MMLHEWYRERLARRRRETEAKLREADETVAQLRQDLDAWHAWDSRRRTAAEKGEAFHEPSPTGTDSQNDAS